jgi:hypothetical protein
LNSESFPELVAWKTILFYSINLSFSQNWSKTLESNCNWKNYLTDSRFVPLIDRLTFPPIGGTFFCIQTYRWDFLLHSRR